MEEHRDDARRLKALRARLSRIGGQDWRLAAVGGTMRVVRPGMDGEAETLCVFAEAAGADEMTLISDSLSTARFLAGLVDRAAAKIRELSPEPERPRKDYAAEAAMLCGNGAFQRFLADLAPTSGDEPKPGTDIPATDRAAARLRSVLGISSRRDLNADRAATERWRRLKNDYFDWLKRR